MITSNIEMNSVLVPRFRTFEHGLKDIVELADRWERATGLIRPVTPSEGQADSQEEPVHHPHPSSGKKGKKGGMVFFIYSFHLLYI